MPVTPPAGELRDAARPTIAACLIVRDEALRISGCLAGLVGTLDEVIVYDTGSVDDTIVLARGLGASVFEGYWDDDFARARNAAMQLSTADWVLSVDADEVARLDAPALRNLLAANPDLDGLVVRIDQSTATESYQNGQVKLFRRLTSTWQGRVHERIVGVGVGAGAGAGAGAHRIAAMPEHILTLQHTGYQDAAARRAKSARNVELGMQELADFTAPAGAAAAPDEVARVLLDLGRSLVGCDRQQDAADVLATIRSLGLIRGDACWLGATELLIRLALAAGEYRPALDLVEQLRAAGGPSGYCDWLAAQALAQLGQPKQAWQLLEGLTELIDSAGRIYDSAQLEQMRALVAELVR